MAEPSPAQRKSFELFQSLHAKPLTNPALIDSFAQLVKREAELPPMKPPFRSLNTMENLHLAHFMEMRGKVVRELAYKLTDENTLTAMKEHGVSFEDVKPIVADIISKIPHSQTDSEDWLFAERRTRADLVHEFSSPASRLAQLLLLNRAVEEGKGEEFANVMLELTRDQKNPEFTALQISQMQSNLSQLQVVEVHPQVKFYEDMLLQGLRKLLPEQLQESHQAAMQRNDMMTANMMKMSLANPDSYVGFIAHQSGVPYKPLTTAVAVELDANRAELLWGTPR